MLRLGATARLPLGAFLDDIATPHRGEDLEIRITVAPPKGEGTVPQVWRAPELLHGLGNIIENAADFAHSLVAIHAGWDEQFLHISVTDDGPGFAPEIFEALGEPYITSRPGRHALGETDLGPIATLDQHEGMGLGFFIAKILLEQTGGVVKAVNPPGFRSLPHHHGEPETGAYLLSGRARIYFGENYQNYVEMSEGDFMFVPPHLPHLEANMSTTEELWWLACRSPENIVVNLSDIADSLLAGYRRA